MAARDREDQGMSDVQKSPPARPVLTSAEPQLFVADIMASCDFFAQKLGFAIVFVYGEPPFYAQVRRDGARLNLRCVDAPLIDGARRERESLLSASITLATADEIKQLFLELQAAGVAFHQTLKAEPWGRGISSSGTRTATCCCSPVRPNDRLIRREGAHSRRREIT
ncbi:MAG TPA: VOC family protein [Xanthobacteraceae bacterium]|jgi:uncharacterized glyoxalase superfamily protein PhnB|nr:VOC family protein [Xanthobacteraceae bacterium]